MNKRSKLPKGSTRPLQQVPGKARKPARIPEGTSQEKEQAFLKSVGENIRRTRETKNLTIRHFASIAGMDNSKLAKFEKGRVNFTILTLRSIADALEVPPYKLLEV